MRFLAVPAAAVTAIAAVLSLAVTAELGAQQARSPQVAEGALLFAQYCALCHGADGQRGAGFQTPIWGPGTQIAKFASGQGLFEYNQMLMPFDDPTKLTDEQKLAITAYILANHGAMPSTDTLTPGNMAGIPIR